MCYIFYKIRKPVQFIICTETLSQVSRNFLLIIEDETEVLYYLWSTSRCLSYFSIVHPSPKNCFLYRSSYRILHYSILKVFSYLTISPSSFHNMYGFSCLRDVVYDVSSIFIISLHV